MHTFIRVDVIAQTISSGYRSVCSNSLRLKQNFTMKFQRKLDHVLAAAFRYALSRRAVQFEVAKAFSGSTPMCKVIVDAIENHVDTFEVDADNVAGLDRWFESAMEEATRDGIDVDSINKFEESVQEVVEANQDDLVKAAVDEIIARLRN